MPPQSNQPLSPQSPQPSNPQAGSPQYAGAQQRFQQNPQGQYDVVEALPVGQNTGHTGHNPYEFIMNPNAPKRRILALFGSGFSLKGVALLAGGAVLLMIVAAIVISALAPKGNTPELIRAVRQQQEIIRIATEGTKSAVGQDTQNFVTNVQASVTTNQVQLISYLDSRGTKLNAKTLALDQDAQTDTLLTTAATAGTFDTTVAQTLDSELHAYAKTLQTAYKETSSSAAKKLIQTCYTSATKLSEQAGTLSSQAGD